jgi:hypothetical protein
MSVTTCRILNRLAPAVIAGAFLAVIFGFYAGLFVPLGLVGVLAAALVGVGWALLLGFAARRVARDPGGRTRLANAPLFMGIIAVGLMIGGGSMYAAMMTEALREPSTTYAVLSALMQPAVPFFIVLNSALELLLVPLIIFGNRSVVPKRRALILVGVAAYFAMRVWTYLVFAEARLEISQQTLSAADVAWFSQTLAVDFRIVLNAIACAGFLLAAFIPPLGRAEPSQEAASGRPPVARGPVLPSPGATPTMP